MKRFTVLTLSMLILLLLSLTAAPVVNGLERSENISPIDIIPDQEEETITDSYFPIFDEVVNSNSQLLRERNDTLGEGAIVQVNSYENVTFSYYVALQNTSTFDTSVNYKLFADLPVVNTTNFNNTHSPELSLTDNTATIDLNYTGSPVDGGLNYTHPVTGDVLPNATFYYFKTETPLNLTVNYLPFYAADISGQTSGSEAETGPYNLITSQTFYETASQDEFYIQNEVANISGNLYFADQATQDLGISYSVDGGSNTFVNFTLTYSVGNGTGNITLDSYDPGTVIEWSSVLYTANDTLVNISRTISDIDVKSVEFGDGSPNLLVDIDPNDSKGIIKDGKVYSVNSLITYNVETSVPKGNITSVTIEAESSDSTNFEFSLVNGTDDLVHNVTYTSEGVFNTTVTTLTDKGLSINETFTVYIDATDPEITALAVSGVASGGQITTEDGEVTFNFNFDDDNSGILYAVLDLGNGESVEVSDMDQLVYRYKNFDSQTYEYSLTVFDFAGNEDVKTGSITLVAQGLERTSAPSFGIILFLIVLIGLLTSWWWGPKVVERFQ